MKSILSLLAFLTTTLLSAQWIQQGADIDGEAANDLSGRAMCMPDPFTIAIGTKYNNGNGNKSGHVRVYKWVGQSWQKKGDDLDGDSAEVRSGDAISMPDSNTIAIGAVRGGGNFMSTSGQVKVYRWTGSQWFLKGHEIIGDSANDAFGTSVSMPDPNTLAVGAINNSGAAAFSGHVKVFRWDGFNNWVQKGADIDGRFTGDLFGSIVTMPDSNTVGIAAPGNSGQARVFRWTGSNWVQKGSSLYGSTIHMPDPNTVALGVFNNDRSGYVKILRWNGSNWVLKGSTIVGEAAGDNAVIISMSDSNNIAIGAPMNDGNFANSGHVRVYRWNGNSWVQRGADIDGEAGSDNSGTVVAMPDSNTVAMSAPRNFNPNGYASGHARVFRYQLGTSINDLRDSEASSSFKIYPIPANDVFFFKTCEAGEILRISDNHGRIVYETMINSEIRKIDVSDWPEGIYFLRYGKFTEKVVVGR